MALLRLAVVPIYLRYMGIEAYGLVGFYSTTQALMLMLDFGMAPTINREVARCAVHENWDDARRLLHTFAGISWLIAGLIAACMIPAAQVIATHWLRAGTIPVSEVARSVALIGVTIACRWPIGVYQGALNGKQHLTTSSAISIVMTSISSLGAVFVLVFISPSLDAFFIWQAATGLLNALVLRTAAWRSLGRHPSRMRFEARLIFATWKFSTGVLALSFLGIVFTQLDKVLLSKLLTLRDFGGYMIAATAVGSLSIFVMPFYNSLYPRFSGYIKAGELQKLVVLYYLSGRLLASIVLPIAMVIAVFSGELLTLWTRDPALAHKIAPIVILLMIGSALHGTMYIPDALQLSFGKTSVPIAINLVLLVVIVPATIVLVVLYGAIGGAISWTLMRILYVALTVWCQDRYVYAGTGIRWFLSEVGIPLGIVVLAAVPCIAIERIEWLSNAQRLILGSLLGLITIAVCIGASSALRSIVYRTVRRQFGGWCMSGQP